MTKQTLYRHFNKEGVLLYVGVSSRIFTRIKEHSKYSGWWDEIETIKLEHFSSRQEVLQAEINAIKNERPLYNVVHNRRVDTSREVKEVEVEFRKDKFIARFVEIPAMLPLSKWSSILNIPKPYIESAVRNGQLCAVDIGAPLTVSGRRRLFCTGWHIIDWLENMEVNNAS